MSGKQIWATTKRWLVHCVKRLRLHAAAWLLDRIEKGLGELLRVAWSNLLLLFVAGFAGRFETSALSGATGGRSLKRARCVSDWPSRNGPWSRRGEAMELEQFYIYNIVSPLTPDKRTIIEKQIDDNATAFGKT